MAIESYLGLKKSSTEDKNINRKDNRKRVTTILEIAMVDERVFMERRVLFEKPEVRMLKSESEKRCPRLRMPD